MDSRIIPFLLGAAFGAFIGLMMLVISVDERAIEIRRFKEAGVVIHHPETGQLVPVSCDGKIIDDK